MIANVRNDFSNMGVDEQVLNELQELWESKLIDSRVLSSATAGHAEVVNVTAEYYMRQQQLQAQQQQQQPHQHIPGQHGGTHSAAALTEMVPGGTTLSHVSPAYQQHPEHAEERLSGTPPKDLVPQADGHYDAMDSDRCANDIPGIGATGGIDALNHSDNPSASCCPSGGNKTLPKGEGMLQLDGAGSDADGSSEEDEVVENNDNLLGISPTEENESNDSDLLGSDLDEDDGDALGDDSDMTAGASSFILCQYEKVQRSRNRWKCTFKDGIVHVNNLDYAFHRATAEFEW